MLKNWGVWLGQGNKNVEVSEELEHVDKRRDSDEEKQTVTCEKHAEAPPLLQKAESFSKSMIGLASKKLTETMLETAESLRKSVEEGKLNQIIDKSMLGDFQKEQQRFVLEREAKKDRRNFLRDPPAGVQFPFDLEQSYPIALVMLEENELLKKMRFHLVPREVKEERFWRNYFYRVSLIKQSAQLTALTAQQASESHSDDIPKWERELQEELEEYDGLAENEIQDEAWDREIEEMLNEDFEKI